MAVASWASFEAVSCGGGVAIVGFFGGGAPAGDGVFGGVFARIRLAIGAPASPEVPPVLSPPAGTRPRGSEQLETWQMLEPQTKLIKKHQSIRSYDRGLRIRRLEN